MNTTHQPEPHELDDRVIAGLPADRQARLAARRAFVDMKQLFMRAVDALRGPKAQWLQDKIRQAHDPMDLWLLKHALLSALQASHDPAARQLRAELYRGLDSTFPEVFALGTPPSVDQPWPPTPLWRAADAAMAGRAMR